MANWADRLAKLGQSLSTTGVVPDAKIDAAIARDSEVTSAVSTHAGASDPHADRSFATSAIGTHEADTTSVHGVANTANLYAAGGTDVAVADGGTGSSTASGARTNLGLVIGTDVRAQGSGDPTVPAFATPAVALGTAAAAGAASTVIRSDATIAAFDATVPVTQAYSDAAATGSAAVAARRDHKHGMPASSGASGGTPATVIGTAGAAGAASTFLRTDDTLGILDATAPVTQAMGDAAATGSVAKAARRDHVHGMPALGTTAAAVGTSAGGAATTPSKSDHVHATGAGTPTTSAVGDAAATGSGPAAAMTNHVHGREAFGASAAAVGTSAAGAATTPSRSDHVHATGAGTPSTQAIGDAAATGSGPAASMTDHKHAMPAFGTSPAAVGTQANGSSANIARIDHVHATGAGTPSTQAFGDAAATGTGPAAAMTDHKHAMPAALVETLTFIIDGGGGTITTGIKGDIEVPFACTINRVTVLADQSGSIVVDIWKDTYANYPPTVADTITASAKPTLSSATKAQDSTLTGWTTSIAAGDTIRYNVDSITTCTRVAIALKVTRT